MGAKHLNTVEWIRHSSRVWLPWALFIGTAVVGLATSVILGVRLRSAREDTYAEFRLRSYADVRRAAAEATALEASNHARELESQVKSLTAENATLLARQKLADSAKVRPTAGKTHAKAKTAKATAKKKRRR